MDIGRVKTSMIEQQMEMYAARIVLGIYNKPFAEIYWCEDETKCRIPRQGAKSRMKHPFLFRLVSRVGGKSTYI